LFSFFSKERSLLFHSCFDSKNSLILIYASLKWSRFFINFCNWFSKCSALTNDKFENEYLKQTGIKYLKLLEVKLSQSQIEHFFILFIFHFPEMVHQMGTQFLIPGQKNKDQIRFSLEKIDNIILPITYIGSRKNALSLLQTCFVKKKRTTENNLPAIIKIWWYVSWLIVRERVLSIPLRSFVFQSL
jgi:hypothetical protein